MFVIQSWKKACRSSFLSHLLCFRFVLLLLALVSPIIHRACLNYKFVPLPPFLFAQSLFLLFLSLVSSTLSSLVPTLNLSAYQ
ncbi:hypothetical protein BD770DRAFT_382953 [Pilaira anomala]|nr:hypothetical protein BD770DRAFT_382953 [Pilaira anomala]